MIFGCKVQKWDNSGCYSEVVKGRLILKNILDYYSEDSVKVIVNVMSIEDLELVPYVNISILDSNYFQNGDRGRRVFIIPKGDRGRYEFIIPKGEYIIRFSSVCGLISQKYNFQKSIELDVFLTYSFHTDGFLIKRNFKLNGNIIKKDTLSKTIEEIEYRCGLKNGAYVYYFEDGKVICKGFYKKGKRHGTWTHFYENGNPKLITEYKNGNLDGVRINFYESGKIKMKKFIKMNCPVGIWILNDEQGKLIKQYSFED